MFSTRFRHIFGFALGMLLFCQLPVVAQDLQAMVIELLGDSDPDMRSIAFDKIRTDAKGTEATEQFAAKLDTLTPDAQTGLLSALADRGDVAAKPAIIKSLKSAEETVRVSAVRALAKLGGSEDTGQLTSLLAGSAAEAAAAKTALIQIQGENITRAIANEIPKADSADVKVGLLGVLASRRALDTIPAMLELAVGDDAAVRSAAMQALGALGGPEHVPGMVQGALKAEGRERSDAERNISFVCNRIEDPEKRAEPLLAAMKDLSPEENTSMLVTLGRVGGSAALSEIEKALASDDGKRRARGLSALASWPNASVADKLEELAFNAPQVKHQLTALRALLRIAPLSDGRTDAEKLALLQKVMNVSFRVDDRTYALQRASAIRTIETLRWVLPFVDDPRYAERACQTIVELAHIRELRDDNKPEFHEALDKVMAVSKNATTLERAERYKQGRTWVAPE